MPEKVTQLSSAYRHSVVSKTQGVQAKRKYSKLWAIKLDS